MFNVLTLFLFLQSKDCPDGLFLRAQGICKISKWMPQSNNTIIKVMCLSLYS